jgi:hypothetical protein
MPCRCDYMEPNRRELDSKETAENIVYLYSKIGTLVQKSQLELIKAAASNQYGSPDMLEDLVKLLCFEVRELTTEQMDTIVFDGKSPEARQLAEWWQAHEEADKQLAIKEKAEADKKAATKSAKAKLTKEEIRALGLD